LTISPPGSTRRCYIARERGPRGRAASVAEARAALEACAKYAPDCVVYTINDMLAATADANR
jgi:hypothetical protein